MWWKAASFAFLLVCASVSQAVAQKKVALVIGNEAYVRQAHLDNPARDARVVAAALKKIGFTLVGDGAQVDLNRAATYDMVKAFGTMAKDADVALFYFSGHGMQISGVNYLFPIDVESLKFIEVETLNANLVVTTMNNSGARLKMVLLDACRTNPFIPGKGPDGGLASMQAPTGTVIGFATQPNTIAWPGPAGANSPYARALADFMGVKGLQLFTMLNEVGLAVMKATKNAQQPWIQASPISGKVYLNPPVVTVAIPATPPDLLDREIATPPLPSAVTSGKSLDFIQRASKQLANRDYAGARATLTQAIEVDPSFAPAFSYLGFAYYLDGLTRKPQEALALYHEGFPNFDKAIKLDQNYGPVRRHRGNAIVAVYRARRALGKPTNDILDRAIDDLKAAVQLDPTSKVNANALGEAYLLKGWYRAAIDSFNSAIEHDRSYAAPYSGLCTAFRMLGDSVEARRNAQLAASRDDDLQSKPCLSRAM
jgi:Tfp pilus assembly protein PilF